MVEWWCSHLFDMPASESQRVQMAHTQTYRYQKLGLVFTVPQIQTISDICIDIRTEDLMNVYGMYVSFFFLSNWLGIYPINVKILTPDVDSVRASKLTMMEAIHEHIYNTMRLKLSSLVLIRIGLPVVFVTHEGKLKVKLTVSDRRWSSINSQCLVYSKLTKGTCAQSLGGFVLAGELGKKKTIFTLLFSIQVHVYHCIKPLITFNSTFMDKAKVENPAFG